MNREQWREYVTSCGCSSCLDAMLNAWELEVAALIDKVKDLDAEIDNMYRHGYYNE